VWFILWYWGYATHRKLSEGWGEHLEKHVYKYDVVISLPRGSVLSIPACLALSCPISCSTLPCPISCSTLPCPARPCHVLTCPPLPACRVLPCSFMSCAALSCPAPSYPAMSCHGHTCPALFPCMLRPALFSGHSGNYFAMRWELCPITPLPCWPFVQKQGHCI
jgi:hypothetical protein